MKKHIQRVIGLVLALAMIASFALVPSPMDIKAEAATVPNTELCDYIQDGVTLHCWNWSIANIKANLGLIASMGYSSIQLSPMQELKEGTVNKPVNNWWAVYQPISFNINTSESHAIGTKDELIDLCNEAHKYDIKVIMDVVCNHTANNGNNNLCPMVDPDLLNDPACWHDYKTNSWDYGDRYNITQYCMAGLPDLNTANQKVQDKALAMLKEYIDCGVDGFRFDAAKQIETPDDHSSFASDFWPTVINGASDYAAKTRNIMLYNYGELLENPDNSGSLHISAYTKYMSVTESVWSNDVRYKLEAHSAAALRKAYFKEANADKLVLWAESHDTVGDGSSIYSTDYNIAKAWSLVASRAYTMSLYFPRPNSLVNMANDATVPQEMGEMAKIGWNSAVTKAVNQFHNHFAGQSEYLTQDTSANLYYNERGNSGVIITNFNDGGRDINLPVYAMANGTYYDQITGNKFTVNNGRIYGSMGDTGIAVVYNPTSVSCSHAKHGLDGYCYDCYTYVGHKSGTKCSVCGTASTRTIYFENTAGWKNVYVYGWHDNDTTITSAWPGNKMTKVSGNLYSIEIPTTATNIIFNNNDGTQTANLVPSASDDTYHYDTSFWTTQGEVVTADNYYLFYATSEDAYNGYDYRFADGKLTMSFTDESYVWIIDSNGTQYMTDGWQGKVDSVSLYDATTLTDCNKLYVPAGVEVTFTMVSNADGSITLSYTTGASVGGGGESGGETGGDTSDTITVYFQNNWMWSDVCAYYWGGSNPSAAWPGNAMTKCGNDGTYDIYSIEIPTDITGLIINGTKNDGSGTTDKTPDLTSGWYDGICYYMTWNDGNQVGTEDIDVILPPEDTTCEHSYTGKVTKEATCDAEGIKTYTCSKCGDSYIESIAATGHNHTEKITTAATCTTPGIKTYTCSKCGDSYTVTFAATGHSYTSKVTTAATCTSNGVRTYTCSACKDSYTEVIAASGHSYSDGVCTVCGAADPNCDHSYTSKVTTAATCLGTGLRTYTCSKCGDVYTEEIPANGHDYVHTVVDPTCENNGYTIHSCKNCSYSYNDTPVNPIGHDYTSVVTPPTCTEEGYTTYTCGNCGNVYTWNKVAATGHSYVGGVCTVCGDVDTGYVEPDYYLFGYINGADYGCGDDLANLGAYKFVNGKVTVSFTEDSYVAVKTSDNATFYMTNGYVGEATSATLYAFTDPNATSANKLLVSGLQTVTFTLTERWDGNFTISYTVDSNDCVHSSHNTDGICDTCGATVEHTYSLGVCTGCGAQDPDYVAYEYYLFGYINGANYGCEEDSSNIGTYKFVDGKLTVTFDSDSYVAIKEVNPGAKFGPEVVGWYMTEAYVTDTTAKLINTNDGGYEKMLVPGGVEVTFTLVKNDDGTLTLSYEAEENANMGYVLVTDASQITAGGKFVIVANGMAMGTTLSSGKFAGTAVTIDGNVVTGTDLPIWTIEGVSGGITISLDGSYLNHSSSTNFKFADTAYTWTVAAGENGYVLDSAATTRGIYFQISSSKFGAYAISNANSASYVSQLQLYKYMELPTECDHNYVGGTCTICGEADPDYVPVVAPTISLQYPTLLLEDEIKMNVFFTLDQDIPLENMGMLTWTAKPSVVDISTADAVIPGGTYNSQLGFYGVATEGIPAQNLGDVVYFCIYVELADGSIAYGKQVQYSPTTYAYNQLNGSADAATKALFVAILNYGSAAQVFLDDTDPLINANLTAEQKALVEEFRADMVHSVAMPSATKQGAMAANGGFSSKRPTISLDSAFAINYFFKPSAEVAGDMTFYYWNAVDFAAADVLSIDNATGSKVMTNENGTYGAAIEGIAAKDIDGALYACGVYTDASGNTYSTGILPYSLGFYCGNTASGEGTLADLAAAIAVYGYYAVPYFAGK